MTETLQKPQIIELLKVRQLPDYYISPEYLFDFFDSKKNMNELCHRTSKMFLDLIRTMQDLQLRMLIVNSRCLTLCYDYFRQCFGLLAIPFIPAMYNIQLHVALKVYLFSYKTVKTFCTFAVIYHDVPHYTASTTMELTTEIAQYH